MKKMLMVATVPSMIGQFNMNNIQLLQEMGYEVHVACDFQDRSVWNNCRVDKFKTDLKEKNISIFQIDFSRKALKIYEHIKSYKQILKLVNEQKYDFVHCHTPIAAALVRLVCKKKSIKCIYTAHGFHFYRGSNVLSWLIYYPIEKWCAKYTDVLITINKEDYELSLRKMRAKKIEYVPGVGVDVIKYKNIEYCKEKKRKELKIPVECKVIISVGELNANKNHSVVIKALTEAKDKKIHYLIAGQGEFEEYLLSLANKYGVGDRVHLLGYRMDIPELFAMSDIFMFPSKREGLSVALMEAMAAGLPCIVSDIRGNRDLIIEGIGGHLCNYNNSIEFANSIDNLFENKDNMILMKKNNQVNIYNYDISAISKKMGSIYSLIGQDVM